MEIKTHTFNGVRYNILSFSIKGTTDTGNTPKDLLNCAKKGTRDELITWIHEAMHACEWNKSEKVVDRTSKDIGRLLWRLGYRRVKSTKNES